MTSNPPGQCCTVGVKHEGEPKGELKTISGYETYIATPPSDKAHKDIGILIITDVIGHKFNNVQLIADQFAANGYVTYMPDIFQGDPIPLNKPEGFDIFAWLNGKQTGKAHGIEQVEPVTQALVKHLREEVGLKRVGAVGYCFGAKYVVRHMGIHGNIDVGYVAHPSFVEEAEFEKLKGPLSISAAYPDQIFPPEKRHKSEEILQKIGVPYQINLFSHVDHGFAVRGDPSKRPIQWAKEQAFVQAVQWFDEYLPA